MLIVALAVTWSTGCGGRARVAAPVGQAPELFVAFYRIASPGPGLVAYDVQWRATTRGAPLSHFIWALDPPSFDPVGGTQTTDLHHIFTFPRDESHTVAVRAVDQSGAMSEPWAHTFAALAANQPPMVWILQPAPQAVMLPVTSNVTIEWWGSDPDVPGQQPLRYLYRLFPSKNPDFPGIPDFVSFGRAYPDSLYAIYSAGGWPGWVSVPPESISASFTLGPVGSRYLFAITCQDVDGAFDPAFSNARNLLGMTVVATTATRH